MPTAFKVMVSPIKLTPSMSPRVAVAVMAVAVAEPVPDIPSPALRVISLVLTPPTPLLICISEPAVNLIASAEIVLPILIVMPATASRIKVDSVEAGRRSMMLATVRSPTLVLMSRVMMSVSVSAAMLTVVGRVSAAARLKSRLIVCGALTSVVAIRVLVGNSVAMM